MAPRRALIDTSALVLHFRGRVDLRPLLDRYDTLFVSAVTVYEMEYGARRAGRFTDWEAFHWEFLLEVLPLGEAEARRAAALQAELARQNARIGERDALIAGTALVHRLPLITANIKEFRRVPGLVVVQVS